MNTYFFPPAHMGLTENGPQAPRRTPGVGVELPPDFIQDNPAVMDEISAHLQGTDEQLRAVIQQP